MYRKVLLAYDGSIEGRRALREGAKLAQLCGAEVFLLAVVETASSVASLEGGVMISMEPGISTSYALNNIQARGKLFVGPQEEVYAGMIVGENARPEDLPVNPCKAKHLTNMRSQGDGKGIQLEAPLRMTLERAIEYISADEFVEATPKSLRLRKRILDATARKRAVAVSS